MLKRTEQELVIPVSQRFFQELHNTIPAERNPSAKVPMRAYAKTLKAMMQIQAISYLHEFLDEVFSAERACRFFRTFLQRFVSDSNGSSDGSLGHYAPVYALAVVRRPQR